MVGNARPTTPYLDQLALSSSVFDNAYANGVRSHRSIPSILTGRYPSRLKMAEGRTELMTLLPVNTTVAERMPLGYGARRVSSWRNILKVRKDSRRGLIFSIPVGWTPTTGTGHGRKGRAWPTRPCGGSARRVTGRGWRGPYLYDPHLYWHDTPFGTDELARYDAAVAYVDAQLGKAH